MRVLYDGHVYRMQPVGGITRYLVNIINGLPEDWNPVLTVGNTRRSDFKKLIFPSHRNLVQRRFPGWWMRPRSLRAWVSRNYFSRIESRPGYDLIHSVHHSSLSANPRIKRRA